MAPRPLPAPLRALADRQAGVLSRAQLRHHGLDWGIVRNAVAADRWQTAGPHAVVLQNAALLPQQREWVAVLQCGARGGVLAGPTAAALLGLRGYETATVHVLVDHDSRVGPLAGVRIHRSRRLADEDVHPVRIPPVTRIDRSIIDAACWARNPRDGCALLAAAVQQGLTTAERLEEELRRAPCARRRRLFLLVLGDIAGGSHSLAEIDFAALCRKAGLPPPLRQQLRVDAHGRRRYLDVLLRARDGTEFAVEIDGALHLQPLTYWDDMARGNEITIAGTPVLRFPALALRLDPGTVMDQIRRMYDGLSRIGGLPQRHTAA